MKSIILLLAIFSSSQVQGSVWDSLTANIVVVEFQRELNESVSLANRSIKNYEHYKQVLEELTKDGTKLDMVIFPEGSLGIVPKIAVEVASADNPCDSEKYKEPLKSVSCLARQFDTYLVTNIAETTKCDNPDSSTSKNCKENSVYIYNTDLVFDRNGTIVSRYRKYNLFGELDKDIPKEPQVETVETDFGPKFGIFTCFDILFKSPAQDVLNEKIDGVIYPTNWHSELPFLTALQSQQMWAYAHKTVIFAAGGNEPLKSSGGSGVFKSDGTVVSEIVAAGGSKALIYKSVDGTVDIAIPRDDDILGKEMDAFPLWQDDSLTNYSYDALNTSQTEIYKELCQGDGDPLCCKFNVTLSKKEVEADTKSYSYFFVAYKGTRTKQNIGTSGIEICGIIACLGSDISMCGQRFSNYSEVTWPLTFEEITIAATYDLSENKTQFPNSLKSSIRPIDASETQWTSINDEKNNVVINTFKTTKAQNRLLTFAIYGRDFGLDALPDNNAANSVVVSLMVFMTMIVAVMIR